MCKVAADVSAVVLIRRRFFYVFCFQFLIAVAVILCNGASHAVDGIAFVPGSHSRPWSHRTEKISSLGVLSAQ